MTPQELSQTVFDFKQKYPHIRGLDGEKMRKILDGDLIIVNKGSNKFMLWTKEDIQAGKLAALNAKTKAKNKEIRAINKAKTAEAKHAVSEFMNGNPDELINVINRMVK